MWMRQRQASLQPWGEEDRDDFSDDDDDEFDETGEITPIALGSRYND